MGAQVRPLLPPLEVPAWGLPSKRPAMWEANSRQPETATTGLVTGRSLQ